MKFDIKDVNVQIMILAAIVFFGSLLMLRSEEEQFRPIVLVSKMTPQQVQTISSQPSCKQALMNYCPMAAKSQAVLNGVSLVPELAAVQNSCGTDFPVNVACNNPIPNWVYLQGGIQAKPNAGM